MKDTEDESVTINDLAIVDYLKVDDVYMARYRGVKKSGAIFTEGPGSVTVTVGGYNFTFESSLISFIFTDGKMYSLESAYSSGAITEDQLRRLWELHKEENAYYYESNEQ